MQNSLRSSPRNVGAFEFKGVNSEAAANYLTLIFHTQEVQSSVLGAEETDLNISCITSVTAGKMQYNTLQYDASPSAKISKHLHHYLSILFDS
jgi:hypothetical protein